MIKLAADENFNNNIVRGLRQRIPHADITRIQDHNLSGEGDAAILEWCANTNHILISHDAETIPAFAFNKMKAGVDVPGVIIASQDLPIGQVIEDLLVIIECSDNEEWRNQVCYLPL